MYRCFDSTYTSTGTSTCTGVLSLFKYKVQSTTQDTFLKYSQVQVQVQVQGLVEVQLVF